MTRNSNTLLKIQRNGTSNRRKKRLSQRSEWLSKHHSGLKWGELSLELRCQLTETKPWRN